MSSRILIADDHEIVRRGIRSLLATRPQWTVCGEARDGLEAVEQAKILHPDIILMDISMPNMDGLQATRLIRKQVPEAKVVIVSQNDPVLVRIQVREADAAGYVPKSDLAKSLLPTLDTLIPSNGSGSSTGYSAPANRPSKEWSEPLWLAGGGTMGRMIQEHDWSVTTLGPIDAWPQSLKTSINLILNSQHAMWIGWGPDLVFLYNDAYIEVLSAAKHPRALGRPVAEVWAEIWDICGPLAGKVLNKGEASFVDEVRLFMNRGGYFEETYYSFSYSPIRDESGRVAGLFCPSTEVTPKVINARRLQSLSELSANALVQRTVDAACESAIATLGKNPDDVPFAALYLLDEQKEFAHLKQSFKISAPALTPLSIDVGGGAMAPWPVVEVVKSGQPQLVPAGHLPGLPLGLADQPVSQALALPLTSREENRPLGVLIAGVNPTRKIDREYQTFFELVAGQIASAIQNARAAEEERARLEALAEIDRAKTIFFSNVSHEFRTPLTLMLGPVEDLLARSHTDLTLAAKAQLELVSRNGSRLLRLVNTLLDFSRLEAGRMQAVFQPTRLAEFTAELASVFRSATERAGLTLEIECAALSELVFVDRDMWEKIVLNLISNAFKFTFDGSISVSVFETEGEVELSVADTGVGIPPEDLGRLFERFHRIENTKSRTHEGSGIGLALVQELVKLHGGSVRVKSQPGKGSTFTVTLPKGSSHLPSDRIRGTRSMDSTTTGAAPFVQEALRWLPDSDNSRDDMDIVPSDPELLPVFCPPATDGASAEKLPSVLVVDDNADMRQYVVRLLAERYEIRTAVDGSAALQAIRERAPELVLSDVMMPNLDGFGLLKELRSDPKTRTIPVILLSARAGEESRVEGMRHGADDYLIKPFSARELLARVQTHIAMARLRRQTEESLRDTKERLEAALTATEIATWTWDIPNNRVIADQNLARLFALSPDEAAGVPVEKYFQSFHPEDRPAVAAAVQKALRGPDGHFDMDYRLVQPDGSSRWVTGRGSVERNEDGQPIRFPGVVIDITERRKIEERERQVTAEAIAANAKFRAVFDQTSVFAGIMSLEGIVLDANRLCLDACGYRADEVLGRPFHETAWWRDSEEVQGKIREATARAAEGLACREVLPYSLADGSMRLVDFSMHPIRDPEGKILFLHPTGIDITDVKRAEEAYRILAASLDAEVRARTSELEQRNAEVLQQSELLQRFSRRLMQAQDDERRHIARELHDSAGQILTELAMNVARVAQHARTSAPQIADDTDGLMRSVQQLSQEIRTMSYLLHPPLLEEAGLAEAIEWYTQGLTERSGLKISLTVTESFGRLSHELELVMFRLMQECLTNIHRHSESKRAEILLERTPEGVLLRVQDEGKGMVPEKLAEVQSRGSGVGMRGMRERVRQFDGTMKIESDQKGTMVSFWFPMLAEPESSSAGAQASAL